ncbi:hypothetical protein [Acetobacteroides hydrogenigenes]|uniref:Uncharacterized protein n=1 Tax=Acetobacteroides hydrogenigenes TaxID=979970 RepID=A0A4R2F4Q2_9BACT|nr:hypothetical protein [Acetobacteroides hydrogenigenes]TCN72109.1 hypothetical protein CLV25_10272 [Acetobacteroides hydrogenigenes]
MRKFKFLMFSLLLAGAAFTSCSKDDLLDVPEIDNPVVTIKRDGVAITTINDKNAGEVVPVVARFDMGAQESRLEKIKITTLVGGQSFVVLDSTLNDGWFNRGDKFVERKYNIAVGQSTSTITFETKDVKGRVGSTTITVAPAGTPVPKVERVVLLAGQLNTTATYGGFYSVAIDKSFKLEDAVTNAQYIDFVYYYGNTNKATISPVSDPIFSKYEGGSYVGPTGYEKPIAQFAVKNATKFAAATADNYTAGTMPTATFAAEGQTNLAVGDYRAFKTVLGQKGIFRVVKLEGTDGSNRSITLDVKVIQ